MMFKLFKSKEKSNRFTIGSLYRFLDDGINVYKISTEHSDTGLPYHSIPANKPFLCVDNNIELNVNLYRQISEPDLPKRTMLKKGLLVLSDNNKYFISFVEIACHEKYPEYCIEEIK